MTDTNQNQEINMVTNVRVRVVFSGDDVHEFDFADMVEGRGGSTPDVVADDELVRLAATYLDRNEADFRDMVCSRPATGNILISPKPVFGAWRRETDFDREFKKTEKQIDAIHREILMMWAVAALVGCGLLVFLGWLVVMLLRYYGMI